MVVEFSWPTVMNGMVGVASRCEVSEVWCRVVARGWSAVGARRGLGRDGVASATPETVTARARFTVRQKRDC
jgi:hypothetical protein